MTTKTQKKKALRFNEYYDTQDIQDKLYQLGKENYKFINLVELITDKRNVMLAYRTIKTNKGSKTAGTNSNTITELAETSPELLTEYVKIRLKNYIPHAVKRVEIPKPNGKTRPLGIPTIEDRLVQQCIRQILEPILEAKFYEHSYGFRPDKSTSHAVARFYHLAHSGFHYVVDIDIKGFFDNVNHGKLLKQLWTLGIRDKNLICRTKHIRSKNGTITQTYQKFYKEYGYKKIFIAGTALFPIAGIKFREPKMISKECTRYTVEGRNAIHKRLQMNMRIIHYLMEQTSPLQGTTEFNDNRISVYVAQRGKCKITGKELKIGNMDLHHIKPKFKGGSDEYKNLIYVTNEIHILIHSSAEETTEKYLKIVKPDKAQLNKINQYRVMVGNNELDQNDYH